MLLQNLGILRADGEYLSAEEGFLRTMGQYEIPFAICERLVKRLSDTGEIGLLFPVGSLSWGTRKGELNVHIAQVPIGGLGLLKLFRDLDIIADSQEGPALAIIQEPFSATIQSVLISTLSIKRRATTLSPEQLRRLQETQAEQGADAEEYVVEYERKRLQGHPRIELVKRISLVDVGAGYDIESFEGPRSFLPDRFIEVKSHKGSEHFFWSIGELEAAKELGDRYHLYLVDMDQHGAPEYAPFIIRNPAVRLFEKESDWTATPVGFEMRRKTLPPNEHS